MESIGFSQSTGESPYASSGGVTLFSKTNNIALTIDSNAWDAFSANSTAGTNRPKLDAIAS